jgi:hypothetical protein
MNAALHMLRTVETIAAGCRVGQEFTLLAEETQRLLAVAEEKLPRACLDEVRSRAAEIVPELVLQSGSVQPRL